MARSVALLRRKRIELENGRCRYALKASEIPDDLLEAWIVEGELPPRRDGRSRPERRTERRLSSVPVRV